MNVESNRNFFNNKAEEWDNIVHHDPGKIQYLLNLLGPGKGEAILDVGTGTGVILPYLVDLTAGQGRITAIDLAEKMIQQAQKKYGRYPIEFISGDVTFYPLPEKSYDAIICYSVFPHFVDPGLTVKRLAALLKPGGRLLIGHSESRDTINARHRNLGNSLISHGLPPVEEVTALLEEAGLQVVDQRDSETLYYVLGKKYPGVTPEF